MRVIVQRVTRASVSVGGNLVSKIENGVMCLTGLSENDTEHELQWMAKKLLDLRLWPDDQGKPWRESVSSSGREILLVSQFTLYAEFNKGKKPDFHKAMGGDKAKDLYAKFVGMIKDMYEQDKVQDGEFGANMQVELVNDGPVTFTLESPNEAAPKVAKVPVAPPSNPKPKSNSVDPSVQMKRLQKKLGKIEGLKHQIAQGKIGQVTPEQQQKLDSEASLKEEIETLKKQLT